MGYRKFREQREQKHAGMSEIEVRRHEKTQLERRLGDPTASLTYEIAQAGGYNAFVKVCTLPKQRKAPRRREVFDES